MYLVEIYIANKMLSFLRSHGVDLTKLRGQAYDGAGNMSGKINGAAAEDGIYQN